MLNNYELIGCATNVLIGISSILLSKDKLFDSLKILLSKITNERNLNRL